jgi:long-chain acyl-CoA synthetase
VAYFAAMACGAAAIPLDPQLTPSEIRRTLDYCGADLLFYSKETAATVAHLREDACTVPGIELDESVIQKSYTRPFVAPELTIDPEQTALLTHTSGSISAPKCVMLSHRALLTNSAGHALHMELTELDRVLIMLPMHYIYCNTAQVIPHLLLGGCLVLLPGIFTPHLCLQLLQDKHITTFTTVSTTLLQLQAFPRLARYDLSHLRVICIGGGPFPAEKLKQLLREMPDIAFCQAYGLSEAGSRVCAVPPSQVKRLKGSSGIPQPGVRVAIRRSDGREAECGEIGEITVQSPSLMQGYLGRPDATAHALRDGWLYTGDLGYLGEMGELYVVGRSKNVIIRGGVNIYPEEIETTALQHPAIKEILVFGKPHPLLGESVHAEIVLRDDCDVTESEIRQFLSSRVASYKLPEIKFVSELQHTSNGKIKRRQLLAA